VLYKSEKNLLISIRPLVLKIGAVLETDTEKILLNKN